jgi:hypothetical protein
MKDAAMESLHPGTVLVFFRQQKTQPREIR